MPAYAPDTLTLIRDLLTQLKEESPQTVFASLEDTNYFRALSKKVPLKVDPVLKIKEQIHSDPIPKISPPPQIKALEPIALIPPKAMPEIKPEIKQEPEIPNPQIPCTLPSTREWKKIIARI
ncbi:MAG: hypothetical protein V4487_04010, partial [Chlamydiota bacterium]